MPQWWKCTPWGITFCSAGRCNLEPTVEVVEAGKIPVRYGRIDRQKALEIIERHIKGGQVIQEWVIG